MSNTQNTSQASETAAASAVKPEVKVSIHHLELLLAELDRHRLEVVNLRRCLFAQHEAVAPGSWCLADRAFSEHLDRIRQSDENATYTIYLEGGSLPLNRPWLDALDDARVSADTRQAVVAHPG